MALSMFLRSPACLNSVFRQSIARMATQPSLMQRLTSSNLPASTVLLNNSALYKPVNSTPILDAVRSLNTSAPACSFAKDEHPHDHARLWVIERATTATMLVALPAALLYPHWLLDCVMAVLVCAHSFWGLEAIAVDYVRAAIFGPLIPKIAIGLVYAISIATLGGLFYLISHDVGIANTIRNLWSIKAEKNA